LNPGVESAGSRLTLRDVVAGFSVAFVLIPQSMAYADLAGLPAVYGLYAAAFPPIAAALFASSPYLQTGPVALTALLTFGALAPLAAPGSAAYVAMAALLALLVGVFRVAIGLIREGRISYLMSRPLLRGFLAAAAILIVASQFPGLVGSAAPDAGILGRATWTLRHPDAWESQSLVLGLITIALLTGGRRIHPMFPGVILATVFGIVFSLVTEYGGPRVGAVPASLPPLHLDFPWRQLPYLIVPGGVIALVGFAEAASIARAFAIRDRKPWDPDREFISQGAANLASAFSGGFPVGGSFSRSSLNHMIGARTRWSGAVTGFTVLLFLPFAGVIAPLPRAVLSGIVIGAVLQLIQFGPIVRLWKLSKPQALIAWTTFSLTLLLAPRIDLAILIGILLALGVHAWREMKARCDSWIDGDELHLAPSGVLWFGSAPQMQAIFAREMAEGHDIGSVVVHLSGLGRIDLSGAFMLREFRDELLAGGLDFELKDVPKHARRILGRTLGWSLPRAEDSAG